MCTSLQITSPTLFLRILAGGRESLRKCSLGRQRKSLEDDIEMDRRIMTCEDPRWQRWMRI